MTLTLTEETKIAMREEPFGDVPEQKIGETMGDKLEPVRLPEDDLRPGAKFVFGKEVADVFEEIVIPRQVPGYKQMRLRTVQIGHHFVRPGTSVLDIGTSRGRTIRDLIASFSFAESNQQDKIDSVRYIGIDNEEPMLEIAREEINKLFKDINASKEDAERIVKLLNWDLRQGIPDATAGYSLITSVLTLQFVPIEYRQKIIQDIYNKLNPGGAFIWIEKILGSSYKTDELLTNIYHDDKRRNGLTEEAIVKKRESIEGFLVPMSSKGNQELLENAGFRRGMIDIFWRDLTFEAYIAIKD